MKAEMPGRFVPIGLPEPLGEIEPGLAQAALDLFVPEAGTAGASAEGMAVLDIAGRLALVPAAVRPALQPAVQEQFVLQLLEGRPRTMHRLRRLHLLEIEQVEPGPDAPGLDDPVWLRGVLTGPFALDSAADCTAFAVAGRMALSRAEFLEAAVSGGRFSFPAGVNPGDAASRRIIHLLLPGGNAEELAGGAGVVLAFPARDALPGGGNESAAAQLLFDVLAGLREDARRSGQAGPAASLRLPSRPELEPGHAKPEAAPAGGFMSKILGAFYETVPGISKWDALLRASGTALAALPGWPSPPARFLRSLTRLEEAVWTGAACDGLELVALPGAGRVREDLHAGALVISWWSLTGNEGKLLLRLRPEMSVGAGVADLDVEAEYFDDRGLIALCFRPGGRAGHGEAAAATLGGTKTWRTLRGRCRGAMLDGTLWGAGDVGFRTISDVDVRIRRVVVRVSAAATDPSVGPDQRAASGDAVVFFDPRRACSWVRNAGLAAEALVGLGFAVLGAEALADWMRAALERGPAGSVCVFAQDVAPDTVFESAAPVCLIRRYLDAGGSVVWAGDVPFFYAATADGGKTFRGVQGQKGVLGLGGYVEREDPPTLTEAGHLQGLSALGDGHRAQRITEVDVVLSSVGDRWAEAWIKRFCPGNPRGGFVRFFSGAFDAAIPQHLLSLRRLSDPRQFAPAGAAAADPGRSASERQL